MLEKMVGAIGFESTIECRFNNLEGNGRHVKRS